MKWIALVVSMILGMQNGDAHAIPSDFCSDETLDGCGTSLIFSSYKNFTAPQTVQEMKEYCKQTFDAQECVKRYARECMEPLQAQVLRLMTSGVHRTTMKMCTTQKGLEDGARYYPCLEKSLPDLRKCFTNVTNGLEGSSKVNGISVDDRLSTGCCLFQIYNECSRNAIKKSCDDETVEFYKRRSEGYTGELLDLACAGYEKSISECKAYPFVYSENKAKLSTLLPVMISIFSGLDV